LALELYEDAFKVSKEALLISPTSKDALTNLA